MKRDRWLSESDRQFGLRDTESDDMVFGSCRSTPGDGLVGRGVAPATRRRPRSPGQPLTRQAPKWCAGRRSTPSAPTPHAALQNSSLAHGQQGGRSAALGLPVADHGGESMVSPVTLTPRAWGQQGDDLGILLLPMERAEPGPASDGTKKTATRSRWLVIPTSHRESLPRNGVRTPLGWIAYADSDMSVTPPSGSKVPNWSMSNEPRRWLPGEYRIASRGRPTRPRIIQ